MNLLNKLLKLIGIKKSLPVKNKTSSEFEIDNWVLSEFVVGKLVPIVGVKPFPLNELLLMSGAVCWSEPVFVFDWGTHHGKSARVFYETSQYFNIKSQIHTIDLPDENDHAEHPGSKRGLLVRNINEVHMHLGDGIATAKSIVKGKIRKSTNILFFCDGDHSYESVFRELNEIETLNCRKTILIHDTYYQSPNAKYNVGPHKAINDFLKKNKYKIIETNTGLPGMSLLYKN